MGLQTHLIWFKMLYLGNQEYVLPIEHRDYLFLCILGVYKFSDYALLLCSGFTLFLYLCMVST